MLAIGCGYPDGNDLNWLRNDPAFKLACGRLPDTGKDLCSQPMVSRLENAPTLKEIIRLSYALVDIWRTGCRDRANARLFARWAAAAALLRACLIRGAIAINCKFLGHSPAPRYASRLNPRATWHTIPASQTDVCLGADGHPGFGPVCSFSRRRTMKSRNQSTRSCSA
jgi:Transposase DDE domain group 1